MGLKAKIIAFYLPQYHPIPENDLWWGKGFTEWTNVGRAKPLFKGHYQPRIPKDLGYYDLRLPEIREEQACLAKEAGIYGFCYWHYWFGNGKQLLERPFKEVVTTGKPDFPFCLGWANESWKAKVWNSAETKRDKVLIKQDYLGYDDNEKHFFSLLNAFRDKRYIRVDNKPVFLIYKPDDFQKMKEFILQWNNLAKKSNLSDGFYFVAHASSFSDYQRYINYGFNSVTVNPMSRLISELNKKPIVIKKINKLLNKLFNKRKLKIIEYKKALKYFIVENEDRLENVIPMIIPNWDHSPRSGNRGYILHNSSPKLFELNLLNALECVKNKPDDVKIIFLKSWNEWAEGNYVEPDYKYGHGFLDVIRKNVMK